MKKAISMFAFLLILSSCSTDDITSDNIDKQAILVETAVAAEQTIDKTIELLGQTLPDVQISLFSPAPLYVENVYKQIGDVVEEGELILSLDNSEAVRQVERAKKSVAQLENGLNQARQINASFEQNAQQVRQLQKELEETLKQTQEILSNLGAEDTNETLTQFVQSSLEISLKQAEITQAAGNLQLQMPVSVRELESQLQLAKENVRQAEAALEATKLTSPISGILSELNVTKGQAAPPSIPVATIVDLEVIQATFSANSFQINDIKKGQHAAIHIDGIVEPFSSEVKTVAPTANVQTSTFTVQIPIQNKDKQIKGGVKASAFVLVGQIENAVVVPIEAVLYEDTQPFVFVVTDKTVTRKDIVLGSRSNGFIQVAEGLKKGQSIATVGKQRLTEGAEITIRNE